MAQDTHARVARVIEDVGEFLGSFNDMPDYQQPGKVTCPLPEILLLALFATLTGSEGFTGIALDIAMPFGWGWGATLSGHSGKCMHR
ncbi:MAG: hypothetical protein FWD68_02195 [Alphaproteobacteria bacterium]|nr:hypothetical protein [Alphaproteobacteria bacterium]